MKKQWLALALGLLLVQPMSAWALTKPIYIFHTNDIHCGVQDNIPLGRVYTAREEALKLTPNVALIDAGDFTQGDIIGTLTKGNAMINIMNAMNYDFIIPGNHEFDYGIDRFFYFAKHLKGGFYCSNMMDLRTGKQVFPGYKLMQFEDKKVAFVGVTTPGTISSASPSYFKNEKQEYIYDFCNDKSGSKLYQQVQRNVDAARAEGADYVFLVGHLGTDVPVPVWTSNAVAKNVKGIDGIIDGHSHEVYERVMQKDKGIIISQTGTKLTNLGLIIIKPDNTVELKMYDKNSLRVQSDFKVNEVIVNEQEKIKAITEQQIGYTDFELCTDDRETSQRLVRREESNLGDLIADAFRAISKADVVLTNGGGLRSSIKPGKITYGDVVKVLPFDSTIYSVKATGQQILDSLELGAYVWPLECGGFMHISGGSYTIDGTIPSSVEVDENGNFVRVKGAYRVKDVMIGGKPLDLTKEYVVGGINYIFKDLGNGNVMFKDCPAVYTSPKIYSEAVVEYIRDNLKGAIGKEYADPHGQGRIKYIK